MLIYHKHYVVNPPLTVNLVFEFRNFATALSKQRRLLGGRVPPEIVPPGMAPDKGPKRGTRQSPVVPSPLTNSAASTTQLQKYETQKPN